MKAMKDSPIFKAFICQGYVTRIIHASTFLLVFNLPYSTMSYQFEYLSVDFPISDNAPAAWMNSQFNRYVEPYIGNAVTFYTDGSKLNEFQAVGSSLLFECRYVR